MNQTHFRRIVAGKEKTLTNKLLLFFLKGLSLFYSAAVKLRNLLYDYKLLRPFRSEATVISVGNITTGGTGKTPLVIWLCNMLTARDIPCTVLTRGYTKGKDKLADEPAILAKSCSRTKIVINPNRRAGAKKAVEKYNSKVLVMDDGFQHRRLSRDLDIITIDATCPFGYDWMLPAGFLREPLKSLKRADAVIITRTDQVRASEVALIEGAIRLIKPAIVVARTIHAPVCVKLIKGKRINLEELKDKKIFTFCGIGNPDAFIDTLKKLRLTIAGSEIYNDHHVYSAMDLLDIYERANYLGVDLILSTQKDWVKTVLQAENKVDIPFGYLEVKLEFIEGEAKILKTIDRVLN